MINIYCYCGKGRGVKFMNNFARSCGGVIVHKNEVGHIGKPGSILVFRTRAGWAQNIIKECWQTGQEFIFIDTGYFLNCPKEYHRITRNHLQLTKIIEQPVDRWESFQKRGITLKSWQKNGSNILVCPPTSKSLYMHNTDQKKWLKETLKKLKKHTDRKIIIRTKPPPDERRVGDTLQKALIEHDIYALVTGESGSAIEAIMGGIPAIVSKDSAASPVARTKLSEIENVIYPDREAWMRSLSYGMFNNEEIENGFAWKILNEVDKI